MRARPPAVGATPSRALPPGTRLRGEFELSGVLHVGDHGISYFATQLVQRRSVVVREYLPAALAARASDGASEVVAAPGPGAMAFDEGLKAFVHEARLLVGFDMPGLVSVMGLWKEHGTAYMALQHVEGVALREFVAQRGRVPEEGELREWLRHLLDTLDRLHAAQCVHGRITPDTLLITPTGPVLLGFGGGRHAIGRSLREMPPVLAAGHAPVEQYAPDPDAALGPWTDLYALASVVYLALTGRTPMPATERRASDPLVPLREQLAGRYSASLLQALDAALAVWPGARPQSVASFRALLDGPLPATSPAGPLVPPRGASAAPAPASTEMPARSIALLGTITAVCTIAFGVIGFLAIRPTDGLTLPTAAVPHIAAPQDAPTARTASPPAPDVEPTPPASALPIAPPTAAPAPPPAAPPEATAPVPAPAPAPAPEAIAPPSTAAPVRAPRTTIPALAPPLAQAPAAPGSAAVRRGGSSSPTRAAQRASCTALLERASVQPLTHDEVETLKRDCR